ncbi:hypothetical protein TNCV_903451 [Trichonephila clavipes]|nr:hypothetical protein TNCV_903451 [Trichonephila clavipes]
MKGERSAPILTLKQHVSPSLFRPRVSPWGPTCPYRIAKIPEEDPKEICVTARTAMPTGFDDDEAFVSWSLVTKLAPDAERQVLEGYRSGMVALQDEPFIDVPVGAPVFGGRKEIRVVHREANHFWNFAILRNASNRQFDRDRLTTMVKHIGMNEKAR